MEGVNQKGASPTSEVLGAKGSSSEANSSTPGIFSVLFPPPTKEPYHFLETYNKKDCAHQAPMTEASGKEAVYGENGTRVESDKPKDSYFQEEKSLPFHYNSSIYYGGQDVFIQPPSAQNSHVKHFNKDGEDDANMASRGNWWQGSLYY